jgi:hypothetical protein
MVALPSRSTEAGIPDHAPNTIESTDAQALLGRPPVLHGEDERTYAELLTRVRAAVRPKDILEEIWVRDVVDLLWETLRLRRMKASLITVATRDALAEILAPIVNRSGSGDADSFDLDRMFKETPAQELAAGWYKREEKAVEEVEKILRKADLSMDVVSAVALRRSLDDVERIERMIISAEARRNAALREVARHRAAFAEDLRRSSRNVRDAEFTEMGRP